MSKDIKIDCEDSGMRDIHQEIHDSDEMSKLHVMIKELLMKNKVQAKFTVKVDIELTPELSGQKDIKKIHHVDDVRVIKKLEDEKEK